MDETIGVDYDGDWKVKTPTGTDSLLTELNEKFKLTGIGRKRRSSGLGPAVPKEVEEDRDEYNRGT